MLIRMAVLVVLSGLVFACSKPEETRRLGVSDERGYILKDEVDTEAVASAGPTPNFGELSLEQRIVRSDVLARVILNSVSSGTTTAYYDESDSTQVTYVGHIDFSFRVLEYLKGTGPNEITAVVMVYPEEAPFVDNRTEMEIELPAALAVRDTRWDSREAVVFLQNSYREGSHAVLPYVRQPGRYFLGRFSINGLHDSGYTVWSEWSKNWLPEAESSGARSSRATTRRSS